MTSRGDGQGRKPTGGSSRPPLHHRLVSFDDKSSSDSGSEKASRARSDTDRRYHVREHSKASSTLRTLGENGGYDPFADRPGGSGWTSEKDAMMVESPVSSPREELKDPFESPKMFASSVSSLSESGHHSHVHAHPVRPKMQARKPSGLSVSTTLSSGDSEFAQPSPTRRRWEQVRQQFLHSSARSGSPQPTIRAQPSASSFQTQVPSPFSSRPSTPRPSRLAQRLGWGQTVDRARQVASDDAKSFVEEVRRACWAVRFGESAPPPVPTHKSGKSQGDVMQNLYKPFMSASSLPLTAASSTATLVQSGPGKYGLKRPQSVTSLALSSGPSVNGLRIVLLKYSSSEFNAARVLPAESEILSALLVPFLFRHNAEQECLEAIEIFEILLRMWVSPNIESELDRCLWCCRAATTPITRIRIHVLGLLDHLVSKSGAKSLQACTPFMFQTFVQSLFALLPLYAPQPTSPEMKILRDFISRLCRGEYCDVDGPSIEEEYSSLFVKDEDQDVLKRNMFVEGLVRCMENGAEGNRKWLLWNCTEEYWQPTKSFSPILTRICVRKIRSFIRACSDLLSSGTAHDSESRAADAETIFRILENIVLPELESIPREQDRKEPLCAVITLVLKFLHIEAVRVEAQEQICEWVVKCKADFETAFQTLISESKWLETIAILEALVDNAPDDLHKIILMSVLPILTEHLASDPPKHPCNELTGFLHSISHAHPQLFFKPLFTCAASAKEATVVKQIRILNVLAKFLPDFWIRDAEMMSVALMSDAQKSSSTQLEGEGTSWSKARLGQLAIFVELVNHIREIRKKKESASIPSQTVASVAKFLMALDSRLGLLLENKEKIRLVPSSQRCLMVALFLEARLLARSLRHATWLSRVVSWTVQAFELSTSEGTSTDASNEIRDTLDRLTKAYQAALSSARTGDQRKSVVLGPPTFGPVSFLNNRHQRTEKATHPLKERTELTASLLRNGRSVFLRLLVAMSGLLKIDDYQVLAPLLWGSCLADADPKVIAPACFLAMQCAEKIPDDFMSIVQGDLHSSNTSTRVAVIKKLSTLLSWRYQILTQEYIMDMNHRRPFKLTRPPILFIATDMGTSLFVLTEDPTEYKDHDGNVLPPELRKRLSEIGWDQDERPADPKLQWQRTPLSLLPHYNPDRIIPGSGSGPTLSSPNISSSPDPSPKQSRSGGGSGRPARKSSTASSNQGVKRRAVFVHPLVSVIPDIALLSFDPNLTVASAARDFIIDLMRDDPSLLCRPLFDTLAADQNGLSSAIRALRSFLHIRGTLPPALTHNIFNHLAGFLKFSSRLPEEEKPLQRFAYTVPTLSKLVSQVSDMSIRELRRAKAEAYAIPSGSLWFSSSAPEGPMFPRKPHAPENPFETSSDLVWITMIRISQSMLFLEMLKKNPQDVQIIRKKVERFVLPLQGDSVEVGALELRDFAPQKPEMRRTFSFASGSDMIGLSLILSRSYLLLISQVFRSLSRHLNDRNELAIYTDGINRILLAHGDDIGIVGQAMIALMTAATRFQRLFHSGSGYTLFMPAVIKVYTESERHSGIRGAIEYAVTRFFALHEYAFIFQSMSIMSHIITRPEVDSGWTVRSIYSLFSSLKSGVAVSTADAAGIHNINKLQEREALIVSTAEERPQTFLAALRRTGGQGSDQITIALPDEYEGKRFGLNEFALFFINFIAEQDATLLRAELFLRFLRLLTPHLYGATNSVLRDGIEHIGNILLNRTPGKAKIPDASLLRPSGSESIEVFSREKPLENQTLTKSTAPSNLFAMRLEYLSLVVAFTKAGGQLGVAASQRTVELVKVIMKDNLQADTNIIGSFLAEYTRSSLVRQPLPSLKQVTSFLRDFAPLVNVYATAIDFSSMLQVLCDLATNSVYANEPAFGHVVVNQYCVACLDFCELAASEDSIFEVSLRPTLIALLGRAVPLMGVDVIEAVEKCEPSFGFLAGVILPFVLTLKTSAEVASESQWADSWRRDAHSRAWVRLLSYVLASITNTWTSPDETKSSVLHTDRSRSRSKRSSTAGVQQASTLGIAMQILKVIITRGEDDLSASIPGVWPRIASAIQAYLQQGDANFAMDSHGHSGSFSAPHSPKINAPMSPSAFEQATFPSDSSDLHGFSRNRSFPPPRAVDYLLWSFVEWLCLRHSPLVLQMRLFMQEKLSVLDEQLRSQHDGLGISGGMRPHSVFVKPRRRSSVYHAPQSPGPSSPMTMSMSLQSEENLGRRPGFMLSRSPSYENFDMPIPKIVHLGPSQQSFASAYRRSLSPGPSVHSGYGASRALAASTKIKSTSLVRDTYRRIRLAQQCFGYESSLPIPDGWQDNLEAGKRGWTKTQVIAAVVEETKELLEEFSPMSGADAEDVRAVNEESSP